METSGFLETTTGKVLNDLITDTRWKSGTWLPGNKFISYNKLQQLAADALQTESIKKITAYVHVLGTEHLGIQGESTGAF